MLCKSSSNLPCRAAILIGMGCLSVAILMQRYLPETSALDFTAAMLTGMSIATNLWGLGRLRTERARAGR